MPTVLEPIGAGITVALINKFITNNNCLWQQCLNCRATPVEPTDHEDCQSSTSSTATDTIEIHAHF